MTIPDLPPVPEVAGQSRSGIQYRILGSVQQTVTIDMQPGQIVFSDTGAMSWMTSTVSMNTSSGGGLGGMLKRAVSGASLFILDFTAVGGPGHVSFSSDFPGRILPFELDAGQTIIMHKHAFVCAEKSVSLDVSFTRKLATGFFGGEGFILQKLTGPGIVFAELDGDAVEYQLRAGEIMKVEPGHVAMFDSSVTFDITSVGGIKNMLFGGEGLFLASLQGPGRIWLHSMTVSKMAHRLREMLPIKSE